jgi:hypothetical protein
MARDDERRGAKNAVTGGVERMHAAREEGGSARRGVMEDHSVGFRVTLLEFGV